MSYEPTNWKSGDVVTSAKLNKLEQGVANAGGGYLIVNMTDEYALVFDKTAGEIISAFENGSVTVRYPSEEATFYFPIAFASSASGGYTFVLIMIREGELSPIVLTASSADDYPSASID